MKEFKDLVVHGAKKNLNCRVNCKHEQIFDIFYSFIFFPVFFCIFGNFSFSSSFPNCIFQSCRRRL